MTTQVPDPPTGVDNLQKQPTIVSDRELQALRSQLETGQPDTAVEGLTQFLSPTDRPDDPGNAFREAVLSYITECIEHREQIRPDTLRSLNALPDNIERSTAGAWVMYHSCYENVKHDQPEGKADTHESGKHLFFAPDEAQLLEDIVLEQFQHRPFTTAKLPTKPAKRDDWVLCLYHGDNRYWFDLRDEYDDPPSVKFRGFKTHKE